LATPTKQAAAPIEKTFATASFFYPAATNYNKPEVETHFSFNVLYGRVGGLDGLELGLLVNTVNGNGSCNQFIYRLGKRAPPYVEPSVRSLRHLAATDGVVCVRRMRDG
jgi:hypothetical protein